MTDSAGQTPSMPRCGVLGMLLAACCVLPIDADTGVSIFDIVIATLREDLVSGVFLGLALGLPYVFGLLVAAHAFSRGGFGAWGIRNAADLLVLEVVLLGLLLANRGEGIAPWALLGVGSSAMLARLGEALVARTRSTPLSFFVRWGAILIAATFGWLRLQFIGGEVRPGVAIVATCICAALLAAAANGRHARSTA